MHRAVGGAALLDEALGGLEAGLDFLAGGGVAGELHQVGALEELPQEPLMVAGDLSGVPGSGGELLQELLGGALGRPQAEAVLDVLPEDPAQVEEELLEL